jgi:hypothetical protein
MTDLLRQPSGRIETTRYQGSVWTRHSNDRPWDGNLPTHVAGKVDGGFAIPLLSGRITFCA